MSIKRLKQYMDKIDDGVAINYPSFLKFVEALSLDLTLSPELFKAVKVKGDKYVVTFLNDQLAASLKRLAETDVSQRSSLAQQNSSHETGASGSLVIFKQAFGHSQVLEFDQDGNFTPAFNQSKTCLILENIDNFLNAELTFTYLAKNSSLDKNSATDVYFASGNAITNKLHNNLFNRYQSIFLALDLDLGGLKIASTFISTFGDNKVEYLLPVDIDARLKRVEKRKESDYLKKVEAIGRNMPSLAAACSLITKHRKILEQESYIHG